MIIKTIKNKKTGKIKDKLVYPSIDNDGYLKYNLRSDHNSKDKVYGISAHRLFGIVFNDNNDIVRNTDCDHIDRFRWCNKPENTRWVTSSENQNNRESCVGKINRLHNEFDIKILEKWIEHVKKIQFKDKKKKQKKEYIQSLNDDLQAIKNEIREYNNIIDAGQKLRKFFGLGRMQEDKMIKSKYLSNLMENADDFD
jgi:hypothetical protein